MFTVDAERYLRDCKIPLRLACTTESGGPVLLSLWYLLEDGCLCCATQQSARVVRHLSRSPACAFEEAADAPPYCGVRGQALATIDPSRGATLLNQLITRYLGDTNSRFAQRLLAQQSNEVAIILRPRSVYTWNYGARMKDALLHPADHPCP